jgi:hypothetical protein
MRTSDTTSVSCASDLDLFLKFLTNQNSERLAKSLLKVGVKLEQTAHD